ncbi:MAG: hypothetical protein IKE43_03505 [Coriobacteriales bacterium]|nr:hypothetical protein [Coriobacteriales bacterium]
MIFIFIAILIVIAIVVAKRMIVGTQNTGTDQADEAYELLEDEPSPKIKDAFISKTAWEHEDPGQSRKPGCYVILVYENKKTMRSAPADYELAYVGKSEKAVDTAATTQLIGEGNAELATAVKEDRKPYAVAVFHCDDYGMDIDDCYEALRKVFAGERLIKPVKKAKK